MFRLPEKKLQSKLDKITDAATWLREEIDRLRDEYENTTDKFKESDRGNTVDGWIGELDSAVTDIENGLAALDGGLQAPPES